jgi:hypothetical protein
MAALHFGVQLRREFKHIEAVPLALVSVVGTSSHVRVASVDCETRHRPIPVQTTADHKQHVKGSADHEKQADRVHIHVESGIQTGSESQ